MKSIPYLQISGSIKIDLPRNICMGCASEMTSADWSQLKRSSYFNVSSMRSVMGWATYWSSPTKNKIKQDQNRKKPPFCAKCLTREQKREKLALEIESKTIRLGLVGLVLGIILAIVLNVIASYSWWINILVILTAALLGYFLLTFVSRLINARPLILDWAKENPMWPSPLKPPLKLTYKKSEIWYFNCQCDAYADVLMAQSERYKKAKETIDGIITYDEARNWLEKFQPSEETFIFNLRPNAHL